jgi:outer membrane protein OmpA-like peptidoglycan-associated protein
MWRLVVSVAFGAMCSWNAFAQEQLVGKPVDLVFAIQTLVFKVDNFADGRTQALAPQVLDLQVKETATETRIELPADILFDFDKADIRPTAADALGRAAEMIRKGAKGTVRIEGHTDGKGKPDYNQKLSERRATSVQKWLVDREAMAATKFAARGYGATKPAVPNAKPDGSDDPEGRQKNRRVEIVFGKK